MTKGMVHEQNLEKHIEKQMGCMAGFLQIFDRHQILAGKRLYSAKRLPPSVTVDSTAESQKTIGSPAVSRILEKPHITRSTPSPDRLNQPPVATELRSPGLENHHHHHPPPPSDAPTKSPLPLPVFEFKEGTRSAWKFSREAPRLSLDSRAIVDAKGSLYPREIKTNAAIISANRTEIPNAIDEDDGDKSRRSPSVIARLMGLEPLQRSDPEPVKKAELRRSASESRVSKDLYQHRFVDGNTFQTKQSQQTHFSVSSNVIGENGGNEDRSFRTGYPKAYTKPHELPKAHKGMVMGLRKSYFDTADCYPEPKQTASSFYGEIEKRLKMRGIDEPSKDLETLKQILEALQLKGLLHPKKPSTQIDYRNFVYDRSFSNDESPIVVMKPARSPSPTSRSSRMVGNESPPQSSYRSRPGSRRNVGCSGEYVVSPRRVRRVEVDQYSRNRSPGRNQVPPSRNESCVKSPNRRRPLSIETQRKGSDVMEHRRVSPVQSPKLIPRKTGSDQQSQNRSPRNRRPTVEINGKEDESSTMSESSITSTDTDRTKMEEYKEGRGLLERCDKLLHSIAEITTITTTAELQPSPVSVLDSSFYKDESSTSPIMKRSIGFKAEPVESEEEIWGSAAISLPPFESNFSGEEAADCDLVYISEILRALNYSPEDSDVFLLLEKKQYRNGNDTSKVSRLQRRLIFDIINEILYRNRQLPPWKVVVSTANSTAGQASLREIWLEFRKIRERDESEDLFEVICGVLRKDLAGDAAYGWVDCPVEVSEAVLDIERLIFKDLIGETIRDLAGFSAKCYKPSPSCRKLVF
ncbi:Protein LONGIFOLIA [Parasponia andersonii]|uniref:Protein LONGIFOLIA n=1 Tax=Parasponia andersonii TaxID=3476 RepID=A0A2P5C081_PARAD|nr:Protein LONGIFOLIA [Parasponia andersonii]